MQGTVTVLQVPLPIEITQQMEIEASNYANQSLLAAVIVAATLISTSFVEYRTKKRLPAIKAVVYISAVAYLISVGPDGGTQFYKDVSNILYGGYIDLREVVSTAYFTSIVTTSTEALIQERSKSLEVFNSFLTGMIIYSACQTAFFIGYAIWG